MRLKPIILSGNVNVPASKSDGQRATLAAGLAKGISTLVNLGRSDDELQMLENIVSFGAEINYEEGVQIKGTKAFPEQGNWNLGESGLGFRLMAAQCAVHKGDFIISGELTLLGRPMPFFKAYFNTPTSKAFDNDSLLPIKLNGELNEEKLVVDGSQSSQYISGLLMALPLSKSETRLVVKNLASSPYVEMTLDTLKEFGVEIKHDDLNEFLIPGNQVYQPTHYTVESDWSSASCWLVASALGQEIVLHGLKLDSLQADRAILIALKDANCKINYSDSGLSIDGSKRTPIDFNATDCPDLFPALVLYAAFTDGESKIYGINRLKDKESDRAQTLYQEYSKLGVKMILDHSKDCMTIFGGVTVKNFELTSHGDHRIAMSLGIASTLLKEEITLANPSCVSKSYPQFWEHMDSLKAND
ncbi:MAG: 3-phosphoshikimate 1-carboxyvinyltransferase [Lentimonas sp.]